jgi:hypothetical protein
VLDPGFDVSRAERLTPINKFTDVLVRKKDGVKRAR